MGPKVGAARRQRTWQHSRRPLFCPPAGLARQGVASSVGLVVVRVSARDEERESMTEKEEGRVYVCVYTSVCDRAALRGKRRAMGGIVRAVDVGETRRGTNATRSSQPVRDRCVRIIGSVMDLHSRRPGMFENSRSSGMWPAEPPSATSPFSPHSPALQVSQRSGRCSDAYLRPLLAPLSFHDPRLPVAPPRPPAWRPK